MPFRSKIFLGFTVLCVSFLLWGCGGNLSWNTFSVDSWMYQLQNADPLEISSTNFDLVVIDYSRDGTEDHKYSPQDIDIIKNADKIPIAYISIGEAEDYRFYWEDYWDYNPPAWLGRENPNWPGNYAVKYWYAEWKSIIHTYLDKVLSQGFMGVYLDKIDEFEYWSSSEGGYILTREEAARRMIDLIYDIAVYCKSKTNGEFYVILQNGEALWQYDEDNKLHDVVWGWAVEDLFYNAISSDYIVAVPYEERRIRQQYLDDFKSETDGLVFVVDYVDDGSGYKGENKDRIDDFVKKAKDEGYIPYVAFSDRELDKIDFVNDLVK